MIPTPTDRPIYDGEIATYWLTDDGILVSRSKSIRRTVANIAANVALVKQITNGTPAPLLIYLSRSPVPDRETRRFSTEQLPQIYTAMAMISETALASLIMNILFRVQPSPIPIAHFTDEAKAIAWLKQFC
ncbi:STAS/SEC14 domain-containing protein [Chloroflexia bacterium SDU3-3]|nr:STAS/SEC14 domain-containing protein [Chloroflexia bacterium SDU3-3]